MSVEFKPVWVYFENGIFLEAKAFGTFGERVGEVVFNTSMSGYQEIITDPSCAGQFVIFTMPEVGIVGTNDDDMESEKIYASGIIIRNLSQTVSNFRSTSSLFEFFKKHEVMGICDIDTRYLTKMLRDSGSMMMIASTSISDKEKLKKLLDKSPNIKEINYAKKVSTQKTYSFAKGGWDEEKLAYKTPVPQKNKKVVVIDFGVKKSILHSLCEVGLEVEVVNCDFVPSQIIGRYKSGEIQGVFLSNGPGAPLKLEEEIQKIKALVDEKIPMFAICLGHQLLSAANGHPPYKLKFGQHGGNHPVLDTKTQKVEITAQNHNYNVPSSIKEVATITHYNLFDKTIEGVKYNDLPIFSIQHHPEASPGPHDSKAIFQAFANML